MSTTLPHGIIQINEGNIAWYGDITANWQLIDSKIGEYDAAVASMPAPANNGTLTINYGGATLAMFGADDAGNVTADIPAPGDGTLTVTQGGSTLGTFSANQATPETIDIPEPGDGTLTIKVNGATAGTFTANQSTAATANITVPTAVSELTNDSGYLTSSSNLDASKLTSGTVDIERLPQGALERLVKVANEAARYALTTADVQLGDTVQQLDTGIMYVVTDTDHLDSAAGYTEYTAGTAASVPWSGVTGKPTFAAVATSGAYSDLTGTPALAAVATSGAYSDLTGTPTIPTVNNATLTIQQNGTDVQTFTANSSTDKTVNITVPTKTSDLTNDSDFVQSSDLATVATSGNYNDLSNKPTIPTVNNATLTIQKNGTTVKTFTANASSNVTANITVPTKTSDLTNDSGFITSDNTKIPLAGSNQISGSLIPSTDNSIDVGSSTKNIKTLYTKGITINGTQFLPSDYATLSGLATVATSGSYNDLSNKPTIPTVNNATLTIQKNGTTVKTFTANASSNVTANITVPTKTSDLTNDSGFITGVTWNDVSNKPSFATVATSGSYNDLSNKPTIPTVNNATLTIQKNGTTVKTFTANASSNVTANISVPTKTSDLTNDSGFITRADLLPIGSYIQFAGSQAPAGFLVCNGGEISRTTYSALFAVIGTTYGSGDGSTTFNLPNLTDRFLQGSSISGTVKNAGLPNIEGNTWNSNTAAGGLYFNFHSGPFGPAAGSMASVLSTPAGTTSDPNAVLRFDASTANPIYGNSTTVQPPALTCLICIKY